jgi:methionine sulfoxide reductase heme-binding subunit
MEAVIRSNTFIVKINNSILFKPFVFILCLLPIASLVWSGFHQGLGANPAEMIIRTLGDWALYFLLFTLAVTPLRKLLGLSALVKIRRMLGLFVFFYVCLHLTGYVWFDQFFDWGEILKDIIKRPFITLGFATFILLMPLVFTSTNKMMRRLKKRWKTIHQLVYPISIMATLHYFWMTKADFRLPVFIAVILAGLLGYRLFVYFKKRQTVKS